MGSRLQNLIEEAYLDEYGIKVTLYPLSNHQWWKTLFGRGVVLGAWQDKEFAMNCSDWPKIETWQREQRIDFEFWRSVRGVIARLPFSSVRRIIVDHECVINPKGDNPGFLIKQSWIDEELERVLERIMA